MIIGELVSAANLNKLLCADIFWYSISFILAYIILTLYYRKRMRQVSSAILLAPVSVKGGIPEKVGTREIGLILRSQFFLIQEIFQNARAGPKTFYTATAIGESFGSIQVALTTVPINIDLDKIELPDELVIKIGRIEIPLGAMFNLVKRFLRLIPVPYYKKRYLASLIHVSLVSEEEKTQLFVYRERRTPAALHKGSHGIYDGGEHGPLVLSHTTQVKNLEELNNLLRVAIFMILKLYGRAFPKRSGESMMNFVNGLDALEKYRRTSEQELLNEAEEYFHKSTNIDDNHAEALYFYGSLLLYKRSRESIERSMSAFNRSKEIIESELSELSELINNIIQPPDIDRIKTNTKCKQKLLALIYASLAQCCAQGIHRLAKCSKNDIKRANSYAKVAKEYWEKAKTSDEKLHPWIIRALAIVKHVDETVEKGEAERRKRFLAAANLYLDCLKAEPGNGTIYNNLGWIFLKLAEWNEPELKKDEGICIRKQFCGPPAEIAERYLKQALDLNPKNKLSHANLCLLYATPYYLKRSDREDYLRRCEYYGRRALRLDPNYVNGYRDLALSLIRYKEYDKAYEYFKDALRCASVVDKDLEIIKDAVKVLNKVGADESELYRWKYPDPKLLEPPEVTS